VQIDADGSIELAPIFVFSVTLQVRFFSACPRLRNLPGSKTGKADAADGTGEVHCIFSRKTNPRLLETKHILKNEPNVIENKGDISTLTQGY
jgi:hypothetical protein